MRALAPHMRQALAHWDVHDPVMARVARQAGALPELSRRRSGFDSLVTSLTHQQVSIAAGRSINQKVRAACGGRITPDRILSRSTEELRAAGLSRQKQEYVRDLAAKVKAGTIDFRSFAAATDQEIIDTLTQVRGIGVWTAKMFLLFHLARPDIVAPEDLGLRIGVSRAYKLPMSRAAKFMERQAPKWSPYGSLASLALWAQKDGKTDAPRKA